MLTILTIAARFSPNLARIIDQHNIELTTRSQLHDVIVSDPRFSDLDYQCNYRKGIVISVNGNIKTESDLLELRRRIFNNCPHVSSRWLYWEVTIDDLGTVHDDRDSTIFGDPNNAT